jgi:hypothetical protein
MQFTDEQVEAIADALRLANNAATPFQRGGVGLAVLQIEEMLGHGNPEFEAESFAERVYTTTVTRPADWERVPEQPVETPAEESFAELEDVGPEPDVDPLGVVEGELAAQDN